MFCTNCGFKNQQGDRFCKGCGKPIGGFTETNAEVGSMNRDGAPMGAPIPAYSSSTFVPNTQSSIAYPKHKKNVKAVWISIFTAVGLAIAGYMLYFLLLAPKPMDIVNKFVGALSNKDIKTAVSCLDPKYEKLYKGLNGILSNVTGMSIDDVVQALPALSQFSGGKTDFNVYITDIVSQNTDGNSATVRVRLEMKNPAMQGQSDIAPAELTFILNRSLFDGWRITSFLQ